MSEEKLLIEELRDTIPATQDMAHTMQGDRQERAADTIERLIRERDEARRELEELDFLRYEGGEESIGREIEKAEARGYRKGVEDAAKWLHERRHWKGSYYEDARDAILALLEKEKPGA